MKTREIPSPEWKRFLDEFSREHNGWFISVEIQDPEIGAQTEVRNRAFRGATFERRPGDGVITIMADDTAGGHVAHAVVHPTRIWFEKTDQGADEALAIESGSTRTLVRFRWKLIPELVSPGVE